MARIEGKAMGGGCGAVDCDQWRETYETLPPIRIGRDECGGWHGRFCERDGWHRADTGTVYRMTRWGCERAVRRTLRAKAYPLPPDEEISAGPCSRRLGAGPLNGD